MSKKSGHSTACTDWPTHVAYADDSCALKAADAPVLGQSSDRQVDARQLSPDGSD